MANTTIGVLPEGPLSEILVRLPVKSLLICKSVCKLWLHTISNPHFVKFQFCRASTNTPELHTIHTKLYKKNSRVIVLPRLLCDGDVQVGRCYLPRNVRNCSCRGLMPKADVQVVSCCNGLICLANVLRNDVFIWNPSIRRFKKLTAASKQYANTVKIGFGYDSISDVYKVFRVVCEKLDDKVLIVQVYSTGTDSWREFREPILKSNEVYDPTDVVVDGLLYFYGAHGRLISFDLHRDVFGVVELPSSSSIARGSDVLNYQGSVAMVFQIGRERNLWTLDDASGKVSWTKRSSIEPAGSEDTDRKLWISQYLCAEKFYGDKYVDLHHRFFSADRMFNYVKKKDYPFSLPQHRVSAPIKYTETLVSLDGFVPAE